jgi:hypothetical protein
MIILATTTPWSKKAGIMRHALAKNQASYKYDS